MITIKTKSGKKKNHFDTKILDEYHKKMVQKFQKNKKSLPSKKRRLKNKEEELNNLNNKNPKEYTTNDIRKKSTLKYEINKLKEEIYDIENDISVGEYYSKTGDLLLDYYMDRNKDDDILYDINPELSEIKKQKENKMDDLDKLNVLLKQKKKRKVVKKRKKNNVVNKKNDITKFFQINDPKFENEDTPEICINKTELFNDYIMLTTNEYTQENYKENIIKKCELCGADKILIQHEGLETCKKCGNSNIVVVESDTPHYKDPIPDKPGYPYKRINHFQEYPYQGTKKLNEFR